MLSASRTWASKAMERGNLFSQTALHALALHRRHKDLASAADTEAVTSSHELDMQLRAVEKEMAATVDRLRVCYTANAALEVSKFYAARVHGAMQYFGMQEDPLFRQIEARLGRLHGPRATQGRVTRTAIKSAVQPSRIKKDFAMQRENALRSDPLDNDSEYRPNEFPLPAENVVMEANRRDGYSKISAKHRGHWILRDAGIATTKKQRKYDPW